MKKLIALLLALVMVLSLTACGGGRTEAPAEKPAEENAAAAPEAPAAEAGIEEGAVIGVSLPWLASCLWAVPLPQVLPTALAGTPTPLLPSLSAAQPFPVV